MTGELKARCIKELQQFVGEFQERRKAVTEETVKEFMSVRELDYGFAKGVVEPDEKKAKGKKDKKQKGAGAGAPEKKVKEVVVPTEAA